MKAIIMAGGLGTRLRSVTGDTPKPMALLAGKPILEHILALLKSNGINNVCITLHYHPECIQAYFGDGSAFGMKISYRIEDTPLGTAGSVKSCHDFFSGRDFLVISGDCACDFDLQQLIEAHHRHHPAVTIALYPHESPLQYGTVLTDPLGRIVSFAEKPHWNAVVSDLVNTGIYVISAAATEYIPDAQPFDFSTDLFPLLMKRGLELRGLPMEGYWCDLGTPQAYHRCNLDALEGRLRLPAADSLPSEHFTSVPEPVTPVNGICRELFCKNRARAMRLISQSLMEAGADFSDGLSISTPDGCVHIAPSGENSSIFIRAAGKNTEESLRLADKFERFIKNTSIGL